MSAEFVEKLIETDEPHEGESDEVNAAFYCFIHAKHHWSGYCHSHIIVDDPCGMILEEWKVGADEYTFFRAFEIDHESAKKVEKMRTEEETFPLYKIKKNGELFCTVRYTGMQPKENHNEGFDLVFDFVGRESVTQTKIRSLRSIYSAFCRICDIKGIQSATNHRENADLAEFFLVRNDNLEREITSMLRPLKNKYGSKKEAQTEDQ